MDRFDKTNKNTNMKYNANKLNKANNNIDINLDTGGSNMNKNKKDNISGPNNILDTDEVNDVKKEAKE